MRVAPSVMRFLFCVIGLTCAITTARGEAVSLQGRELTEALQMLRDAGLSIVFTSEFVRPGMRVHSEPFSRVPRSQLDEILAPFGLVARETARGLLVVTRGSPETAVGLIFGRVRNQVSLAPLANANVHLKGVATVTANEDGYFLIEPVSAGSYTLVVSHRGFIRETISGIRVAPAATRHLEVVLSPAPYFEEKIAVFESPQASSEETLATTWMLGHDELDHMPHLGDPLRGLSLAPGSASSDLSARISVRGGRPDETRIVLDGQEIFDAYHLKDYESSLTIVPSLGLANANLLSGGLSAAHGDRLGGVVDLRTRGSTEPTARLSVSTLDALLQSSGTFASERGNWLVSARRGILDIASEVSGDEQPSFWDVFGRLELRPIEGHSFRLHAIAAKDDVDYLVVESGEEDRLTTDYSTGSAWLTHGFSTRSLLLETALSRSRSTRDRIGGEIEDSKVFDVRDERDLDIFGASQSVFLQLVPELQLRAGWELRNFDTFLDYESFVARDLVIDAPFSIPREDSARFLGEFHERHIGSWVSSQWTGRKVVLEIGARFDDHSMPEESFWSPRVAAAWQVGPRSAVLGTWGIYRQSHRPYELQVEDGETGLSFAERSEQWSAGWEQSFSRGRIPIDSLHVEIFYRDVGNPRVRFLNLLEPINRFHEVEPDRVGIAPDRRLTKGVEISARGRREAVGWQANYTWSDSIYELASTTVPTEIDQPHAAAVVVDWAFRQNWRLDVVWLFHSGWPTTPVRQFATDDSDDQASVLQFGPFNSERMADYNRLDLRINHSWQLRSGALHAFVELRNVFDRNNVAGYDVSVDGALAVEPEFWPGIVPVVGFTWEVCGTDCGVR